MCVDILLAMMKTRRSRHKTTELYLHVDLLLYIHLHAVVYMKTVA